jgi:hypothetical protein
MRLVAVAVVGVIAAHNPSLAAPVKCTTWQGVTICTDPGGYVSHESTWNGITTGDDNQGDRWTTSTWQDDERESSE